MVEDAIVDMTIEALKSLDFRRWITEGMATYDSLTEDTPFESERLRKEIKRIDTAFERIWQAIEDGIAPPGGKERIAKSKGRKAKLETGYQLAKYHENTKPDFTELMEWLDGMAEELNPQQVITMFARGSDLQKPIAGLFHF